jgi:hypothetical protein
MAMRQPVTQGVIYQHYTGNLYIVLYAAHDSENHNNRGDMVVYMSLSAPKIGQINVRSLAEFREDVEHPEGYKVPRFKYLDTPSHR